MPGIKDFRDKVVIVTGAGSGIGYELALQMAKQGANIIATDISQEGLDKLSKEVSHTGSTMASYIVDHSDETQVAKFVDQVLVGYDRVDVLCCNAGVFHQGKIGEFPLDEWKWVMNINYWGQVYLIDRFVPEMKKNKQGWILITASGAGLMPICGFGPYGSSKSALVNLANIMQMELRKYNINVSALCPGVIATNIMRSGKIQGQNNQSTMIKMYDKLGTHPRKVAKAGVKGLIKNKAIIRIPLWHIQGMHVIYKLGTGLFLRLGSFLYNRGWSIIGPILK